MSGAGAAPMLRPGETLGILGGGQLGRLIALAAARLGVRAHVYAPDPDSPAFEVAAARTVAAYDDAAALAGFAEACGRVTYEFENVPAFAAETLSAHTLLHPNARALATAQDRFEEKSALQALGLATAPFRRVATAEELGDAVAQLGRPAVLKTRRLGYDGRGQAVIREGGDPAAAWAALGHAPAILEGFVAFERELSVVAARGEDGSFAAYEPGWNWHEGGILRRTRVPAGLAPAVVEEAVGIARTITEALGYVGVIGVELFLVGPDQLLVNEIAPRVHNSGHWTDFGAATSQFEQHLRAVCGWPLGPAERLAPLVEMENLLGDGGEARWAEALADGSARLTLYGKGEARPGRKMGHVTRLRGA